MNEWIPIARHLHESREVLVICSTLKIDEDKAVGLLVRFLSWLDGESEDGLVRSITHQQIDRVVRQPGFAQALESADMIVVDDRGFRMPAFRERHGPSARARLLARDRKRSERARKGPLPIDDIPY